MAKGLLGTLLDLMPEEHSIDMKYSVVVGLLMYHAAPETMGIICRSLNEHEPLLNFSATLEQFTALVREELPLRAD